jgi:hypothetical protein
MEWGELKIQVSKHVPEGEIWMVPPRKVGESDADFARRIVRAVNVATEARPALEGDAAAG